MLAPSGEQFEISSSGYRATLTQGGAGLRTLSYDGHDLVAGYAEDQLASGGSGQQLIPWPNRIRDGAYTFAGSSFQLPLSEPALGNASHGLVRWLAWALEELSESSVALSCRLMAQRGYPWTLDLGLLFDLSADGLTVTLTARNLTGSAAPFAYGAHPYLTTGAVTVDGDELRVPANRWLRNDEQMIPVGRADVGGTAYDFRVPRPIKGLVLDHAFTDLTRGPDGRAVVGLSGTTGHAVELWVDERFDWLQVYTADKLDPPRTALAVEPMTAPADAFNSGEGLVSLAPGEEFSASWGIRVAG